MSPCPSAWSSWCPSDSCWPRSPHPWVSKLQTCLAKLSADRLCFQLTITDHPSRWGTGRYCMLQLHSWYRGVMYGQGMDRWSGTWTGWGWCWSWGSWYRCLLWYSNGRILCFLYLKYNKLCYGSHSILIFRLGTEEKYISNGHILSSYKIFCNYISYNPHIYLSIRTDIFSIINWLW